MGDKELTRWVSDQLHEVLGYSESATAQYITALARKSRGFDTLLGDLESNDVPINDTTRRFARELLGRVQGSSGGDAGGRKKAKTPAGRTQAEAMAASAKYTLVLSDEEGEAVGGAGAAAAGRKKDKKDKKKMKKKAKDKDSDKGRAVAESSAASKSSSGRRRQRGGGRGDDGSSSEDDTVVQQKRTKSAPEEQQKEETEEERLEREREEDLKERDELVARMHERDEGKTKQIDLGGLTPKQVAELATRGVVSTEDGDKALSIKELRTLSRQMYLPKRADKELRLLEMQLGDEEELFLKEGVHLSDLERRRIEISKQVLQLAKDPNRFDPKSDYYQLPDSYEDEQGRINRAKKEDLLTARYEEEGELKTEQEEWEAHQVGMATAKYGAQDKKAPESQQYDLVFDDAIDFVSQEVMRHKLERQEQKNQRKERKRRRRKREGGGGDEAVSSGSDDDDDDDDDSSSVDGGAAGGKQHGGKDEEEVDTSQMSTYDKIQMGRKKLPVYPYRHEFLSAVKEHQVIIVVGETGSGKTTQLPQFLHEIGYTKVGKIGCTQPRRVAAMSVAARVSQEMGVKLGDECGYSIRFEDCTSDKTVIKYMTDGMLLRELLTEPDLASYSVMMIDEAHERTLHTDVLFGLVKDICRFRSDFKLIISSATMDAEKFSLFFDDAQIFIFPGRIFPIDIMYTKAPEADYLDAVVVTVLQMHITQPLPGDILVFLTGQEEIEACVEILQQRTRGLGSRIRELLICPIYASLPSDQQAKIFEETPPGSRKVVLGTNIAETSLTIDGICYVIDTGFCKQKSYNPRSGMESLIVTPISKAAARQRSGRAGRTQPGKCFRLYTAWSFQHELEDDTVPEIQRTNMGNIVLMLKSLGINDLLHFDFMDPPPPEALIRALEQLYALGALNNRGELTKLGRRMAEFPLDPMLSKAVLAAEKYGCVSEVVTICSMLSCGNTVFYRPKDKAVHADNAKLNFARGGGGDHLAMLRVYNEWVETNYSTQWCYENYIQVRSLNRARDIREQLEALCERVEVDMSSAMDEINGGNTDGVAKAITAGFFYNTAKMGKMGYSTIKQRHLVYIHPSSIIAKTAKEAPPQWLLYHELAFTTKEYMRSVMPIKGEWLKEIAPHYYSTEEVQDSRSKKMPKALGAAPV